MYSPQIQEVLKLFYKLNISKKTAEDFVTDMLIDRPNGWARYEIDQFVIALTESYSRLQEDPNSLSEILDSVRPIPFYCPPFVYKNEAREIFSDVLVNYSSRCQTMIKEHKEINELVDKFEQDLIKLFSDYGITNFEKTKGMILDSFCYQTTEAKPETNLINEILSSLEWIRFKENGKYSKESYIECFGRTQGLFYAFRCMFIFSTPKESIYDRRVFGMTNPRSNISKLRRRLYNL